MIKKGLLIALILLVTGCAGTIRIAEDDKKISSTPKKNLIVKPQK